MSGASERLRLAALADLRIVGTGPEERFDRVTRIARELFDVPIAEINFIDSDTQFTKSPQRPGGGTVISRSNSFCDVVVQQPDIVVVRDALEDPRFADRGSVTGAPHVRFYAGRPISVADGVRVGTICLVDTVPRGLDAEEAALLDELGLWVERELRAAQAVDRAVEVQRRLLPDPLRLEDGWSLSGYSRPYHEVAGDYFAWHTSGSSDAVDVTVVDVMGKGPAAAIIAAAIRSAFQARPGLLPAEAIRSVNAQLLADFSATGTFATLFHARVETGSGDVRYADAGHGLTMIVRSDGRVERLATLDLPIGIGDEQTWEGHLARLERGDVLFSCTDGALDLFDGSLESLDRLASIVRAHADDSALFAAVSELADSTAPEDDVTAIVLRRN